MKKNLIALAVAGAMVAPVVASAADVSVFGDARVRYTMKDYDNNMEEANTTSRIRVGVKATEGNTTVAARMKATNGTHGAQDPVTTVGGEDENKVDVDYGYMSTKIAGMIDVAGGIMVGNWGNKLLFWDTRPNRVMLSTSMINNVWLGLTFDKMVENGTGTGTATDGDNDYSSTKILVKTKIGGGNAGLLYAMDEDNRVDGSEVDGNILDVYYNGKVGPVALGVEYYTKTGDLYETAAGDAPTALMVTAGMAAGPVNLTALVASFTEGAQATAYVDPVSTVGTNQDTALVNLGSAGAGVDNLVMGIVAGMPVNDVLSVQAGVAVSNQDAGAAGDTDTTITDLQATYKVDANTAIRASYGVVDVDGGASMNVMGVRMQTSF